MINTIFLIVSIISTILGAILGVCKIFDWIKNKKKKERRKDLHMTQQEMFDLIIEMLNDN
jgi:ADP-ribosylglycohydrolase